MKSLRGTVATLFGAFLIAQGLATPAGANQWTPYGTIRSGEIDLYDNQALPPWPTQWDTYNTNYPYTDASLALWAPGWIGGQGIPQNPFFSLNEYAVNCDQTLRSGVGVDSGWILDNNPAAHAHTLYACKITKAPIVDLQWISDNLAKGGYIYALSYPTENHGNGHALVSWVGSCMMNVSTTDYDHVGQTTGSVAKPGYCHHGMARVRDAGWRNQFALKSGCVPAFEYGISGYQPGYCYNYALGTKDADPMTSWPEPWKGTGTLIQRWTTGIQGIGPASTMSPPMFMTLQVITDEWLGDTTPPAPPPLPPPPTVASKAAQNINIGQAGSASGVGTASSGTASAQGSAAFDLAQFCAEPSRDGKPRSKTWINNCIANGGK